MVACGLMEYCFSDLSVEQLAEIVCLLIRLDPQQAGPAQMFECLTMAAALKALPVNDPQAHRILHLVDRGSDNEDQAAEIRAEFQKLIA